ncbi:CheR family methyltransferase [Magnetospirillum sulfuroxidans]|uniref:protein-glutamate O-methyltransferase n=1 Tax=Magnetospirillum sulfuroxidans TaxID=611300 RepID=A0ABS5I8Q7_9PROT|nr:protein-glutamate O-methyltransferase CheR [Magnetospirillum sulfuroxidans]MBR9970790.1 protein-glutamate O-methyltransferase CheR [Magnetospirillum sulfuroxidans]
MTPSEQLLGDSVFPRLKALVIEVTGMAFYADKDLDLAQIIADRMEQCRISDCAAYLELLQADGEEMDCLVAELTIGETYFFRHKEQFDALREIVLPDILARNTPSRRLRIWSAGCATGPEPYSLAILLKREFGAQILGWHVSILGTDINQKFLSRARDGRYDQWAFRATPENIRGECFVPVGKQWQIRPEFKAMVSFQYHNLTRNRFPSITDNIAGFDIIICRNVVIYFSRETVEALVPCFHESLVDGGWLVMGHAEPNMELFRDFRTVNCPGAVLYQRTSVEPQPIRPPQRHVVAPSLPLPVQQRMARRLQPQSPRPSPSPALALAMASPPTSVAVSPPLSEVRHLADQGKWDAALRACDAVLGKDSLNWRGHYLRALILDQMGDGDACESALRRAIYLDRRAVLPHYHLGLFLLRAEEAEAARRSFRNVLALLGGEADDRAVDEGEDLTAGQLRETVGMHMKVIGIS